MWSSCCDNGRGAHGTDLYGGVKGNLLLAQQEAGGGRQVAMQQRVIHDLADSPVCMRASVCVHAL
eukprot:scaffold71746_cov21-Tisochrysis_lutea.AAC.1